MKQLLMILSICLVGCVRVEHVKLVGIAQGSYYQVSYLCIENTIDKNAIQHGVDSIFQAVDNSVSLWNPNSLIKKFNNNEKIDTFDTIFLTCLRYSDTAWRLSNGAFDPTVSPFVKAYGFHDQDYHHLTSHEIDSILQFVGFQNIIVENNYVVKTDPRVELDFNAVAQGVTTDMISAFLLSKNIDNHIVNVGGEIMARGNNKGGMPWVVGIEKPAANKDDAQVVGCSIELHDQAIVTSGNYRKYVEENGRRLPHSINPLTGQPVQGEIASATVIAPNAATADYLATICMILGKEKSEDLIKSLNKNYKTEKYSLTLLY